MRNRYFLACLLLAFSLAIVSVVFFKSFRTHHGSQKPQPLLKKSEPTLLGVSHEKKLIPEMVLTTDALGVSLKFDAAMHNAIELKGVIGNINRELDRHSSLIRETIRTRIHVVDQQRGDGEFVIPAFPEIAQSLKSELFKRVIDACEDRNLSGEIVNSLKNNPAFSKLGENTINIRFLQTHEGLMCSWSARTQNSGSAIASGYCSIKDAQEIFGVDFKVSE